MPAKRPGFFNRHSSGGQPALAAPVTGRSSPQKATYTNPIVPEEEDIEIKDQAVEADLPVTNGGYVFVESPSSKARAARALEKEKSKHSRGPSSHLMGEMEMLSGPLASNNSNNNSDFGVPKDRVKGLPTPPVGPVLPDFDDLIRTTSRQRDTLAVGDEYGGASVKRKTSMVKKLKDKMVK